MFPRQLKVAIATVGLMTFAAAASAAEVSWSKSPLTLVSSTDRACKVIITAIEQDNPGQPIRIRYTNGSHDQRETFQVGIRIVRDNQQRFSGSIDVDNANGNESGDRPTAAFQGSIRTEGTRILLNLRRCEFKY